MADQLPLNFIIPPESSVLSYDYVDIAEGFGYVTYYGVILKDSVSTYYRAIRELMYSYSIEIDVPTLTSPDTESIDISSLPFKTPRIMSGNALINFCIKYTKAGGSEPKITPSIVVYHYDGSTETSIGTWTGIEHTVTNSTYINSALITLSEKKFNIGDTFIIRLTLTQTALGGDIESWIGCDPQGRDGTYIQPSGSPNEFTQFTIRLPFKVGD